MMAVGDAARADPRRAALDHPRRAQRLDLTRPVEREVLEECLALAQQAPTGSYKQDWHFVVVTDPELRAGLAELWRSGGEQYLGAAGRTRRTSPG